MEDQSVTSQGDKDSHRQNALKTILCQHPRGGTCHSGSCWVGSYCGEDSLHANMTPGLGVGWGVPSIATTISNTHSQPLLLWG